MTTSQSRWFLNTQELSIPRRLLAVVGFWVPAGLALVDVDLDFASPQNAWLTVEVGLLVVGPLLCQVNRLLPQLWVRAQLWPILVLASLGAAGATRTNPETWAIVASVAVSLLAMGGHGLRSGRLFQPQVMRRSLLSMMTAGIAIAHVLLIAAWLPLEWRSAGQVSAAAAAAVVVLGVVGLARMRTWGLLLYVVGIVASFAMLGVSLEAPDLLMRDVWRGGGSMTRFLWQFASVSLLVVTIPILWAVVRKRSAAPEGVWGARLYTAAVLVFVAAPLLTRLF